MDQVPHRLSGWWRGLDPAGRRYASALAVAATIYLGHYLVFCILQPFYIEDAGISFAYAKHWVEGDGFVPYPGGERVEGFSNPLWTFLVAAFYAIGVPVWSSSKIMGAVFGILTLPFAAALVRRARVPGVGEPAAPLDVAVVAALLLAGSPQIVLWNASGLENSLHLLLMLAGAWRLLREVEDPETAGPFPWSAVLFFLLAMTRPEGVMYGAVAWAALLLDAIARRRIAPILAWTVVWLLPLAAWNAWRYWYFAWPFPNTYYAKVGEHAFQPFSWSTKGWKYIKDYLWTSGLVWALPLLPIGLVGLGPLRGRGAWRTWLVFGLLLVLGVLIAWDGRAGIPMIPKWWRPVMTAWVKIRVYAIAVSAVIIGLATLTRPGWRARGLLWTMCAAGVFFALYSGGDWMKGARFFSFINITLLPLLAIGLGEILDGIPELSRRLPLPERWTARPIAALWTGRNVALAPLLLAFGGVSAWMSNTYANSPETAVRDVIRRVDYMTWVQRRLDIDYVNLLDVDMGAHMYYSGWNIVDIAGLIDVPMAHHRTYDKKFILEYIFQEENPEFAHVHAGWARTSRINTYAEFKERYLEIPGYPSGGRQLHVGNHVRRDLFIDTHDAPSEPIARFRGGVGLVEVEVPSAVVAAGGELYIHTAWQSEARKDGFRILAVLDGINGTQGRQVGVLPPGYDWYRPEDWKRGEVVHGRQRVSIPEDLPKGTYALSLVLLDEKTGGVLPLLAPDEQEAPPDPEPTLMEAVHDGSAPAPAAPAAQAPVDPAAAPAAPPAAAAPPPPEATAFLPGGWRVPVEIRITSVQEATDAAEEDLAAAITAATGGRCEEAWPHWKNATRHVMRNTAWKDQHEPEARRAIAACYVARAEAAPDEAAMVKALLAGRYYDFRYAPLADRAAALAASSSAQGDAYAAEEKWDLAYAAYKQALDLDPQRAWTRRAAEDVRDRRLGIGAYEVKTTPKVIDGPRKGKTDDDDEDGPGEVEGPEEVPEEAPEAAGEAP